MKVENNLFFFLEPVCFFVCAKNFNILSEPQGTLIAFLSLCEVDFFKCPRKQC